MHSGRAICKISTSGGTLRGSKRRGGGGGGRRTAQPLSRMLRSMGKWSAVMSLSVFTCVLIVCHHCCVSKVLVCSEQADPVHHVRPHIHMTSNAEIGGNWHPQDGVGEKREKIYIDWLCCNTTTARRACLAFAVWQSCVKGLCINSGCCAWRWHAPKHQM